MGVPARTASRKVSFPAIRAPCKMTWPWAVKPTSHSISPSTIRPVAATATPLLPPIVAPRSRSGPMTCARSRRIVSSITHPLRSRMPSVRIRSPLKPGRWQSEIRTVLVVVSTNRGVSSNRQNASTSAWLISAIRSSRPLIRAPTSRIAGARPFSRSPAPSSKAVTTAALTTRSAPQPAAFAGSSSSKSPERRSTGAPLGNAAQRARSGLLRSSKCMA